MKVPSRRGQFLSLVLYRYLGHPRNWQGALLAWTPCLVNAFRLSLTADSLMQGDLDCFQRSQLKFGLDSVVWCLDRGDHSAATEH